MGWPSTNKGRKGQCVKPRKEEPKAEECSSSTKATLWHVDECVSQLNDTSKANNFAQLFDLVLTMTTFIIYVVS